MLFKFITIFAIFLLFLVIIIEAQDNYLSFTVGQENEKYFWIAEIFISRRLFPNLTFWIRLQTYGEQIIFVYSLPAFPPFKQYYELGLDWHWDSFNFQMIRWCEHWFSQSFIFWEDKNGILFRIQYNF